MFVARTILRILGGARSKMSLYIIIKEIYINIEIMNQQLFQANARKQ